MLRRLTPLLVLTSVACAPQNAEVTSGQFTAFLPIDSSLTLFKGDIDLDEAEDHWAIDCRRSIDEDERLDGALDICSGDPGWPPAHEGWLQRDAYEVISEQLDPWRGEAVMTAEGDFQVTFHHRLPGGPDFRFAWVVDPDFSPNRCVQSGDEVELEPIDGANWLDMWSNDLEGNGRLYYLNSGAYQFNPSDTSDLWTLPEEWRAGYSSSRFGAEDMAARRVRYGLPSVYASYELTEAVEPNPEELFYVGMPAGADPTSHPGFQAEIDRVFTVADEVATDLTTVGIEGFNPRVHTNEWRTPDGRASGLDGWVELHYSWVKIDPGSNLEVGGNASGEFFIAYDAFESQTRVFVQGEFNTDRIKRDRWVTDNVVQAKLEENDTTLCGQGPDEID